MTWWAISTKYIIGNNISNCDRVVVEAVTKKEAKKIMWDIFKGWPEDEDGGFRYLSGGVFGPYETKEEAEDITFF